MHVRVIDFTAVADKYVFRRRYQERSQSFSTQKHVSLAGLLKAATGEGVSCGGCWLVLAGGAGLYTAEGQNHSKRP
eukprot:3823798-Amphidinium_carterae.1